MAKIDVLMATYNGEKYIKEQIDSILNQTFSDFNLIIRDDCSTDKTVDIIKQYLNNDRRIFLYENTENLGYNDNFMTLISDSTTSFFAIADQDDIWHSTQLQTLYEAIINYDVDVVYGKSGYINEKNEAIKHREYVKEINIFYPYELFEDNIVPGRNMLVNARLKSKLFPCPNLSRQFIYDWYLTLKAVENNGIHYVNNEINLYRVHTASVTNTDAYAPMYSKSFKEKVFYVEELRQQALKTRIERIQVFNSFLKNKEELEQYKNYIEKLSRTKFINFNFLSFKRYMRIRTPFYKIIFFIIFHFPIFYRIFALKIIEYVGNNHES